MDRFATDRLADLFFICSSAGMARFDHQSESVFTPDDLAATVLTLPGWVRVGLSAPDERMRSSAAEFIAQSMFDTIAGERGHSHPDQLDLLL
uniref:DUF6771 family protein n=1 Tax=uncultured Sphingomonas sp. TaxID=158754 RepID=UPI0035CA0664